MTVPLARVVRQTLAALGGAASDGDLLRQFAHDHDPAAFAELVQRHGPVVLGVCRRTLGTGPDADDAFQATFLALARRPGAVRDSARLAGWLHRVAVRASRRVRARRRPTLPLEAAGGVPAAANPRNLTWAEGLAILDEELNALPDRLRSPLVLCYLDGLARDEAAARLGWSVAFLKRRLAEGRDQLRIRLLRRGVSAAVLAAATAGADGLRAVVQPSLLTRTAGLPFRTVPAAINELAQGLGTHAMPAVRWKFMAAIALFAGGVAIALLEPRPPHERPDRSATSPDTAAVADPVVICQPAARIGSTRFRLPQVSDSSVLSADGKTLVTAGGGALVVWNPETGDRRRVLRDPGLPPGFGSGWMKVAVSADGSLLAQATCDDVQLRIWDLATGRQVAGVGTNPPYVPAPGGRSPSSPKTNDEQVRVFAFSPDGRELIVCGPKFVRTYDARTGREVRNAAWAKDPSEQGRTDPVAISRDGRFVLTSGGPEGARTLTVRDTTTAEPGAVITLPAGYAGYGEGICVSPDGHRAAYHAGDKVLVWELPSGKEVAALPYAHKRNPNLLDYVSVAFSPDGDLLYVGTPNGPIRRHVVASKIELSPLTGHRSQVTGIHPLPDGRHLVSAGWDCRLRRFDLTTGTEEPAPAGYDPFLCLAATADGSRFAVGGSNGRLEVYDADGRPVRAIQSAGEPVQHVVFTPDGRRLAAYDLGGKLRFWDTADWSERPSLDMGRPGDDRYLLRLAFRPDGRQLLTGTRTAGITCWDLDTGTELWRQPAKQPNVAVFTPDGRHVLSGGWDKAVTWRFPETGAVRRVMEIGSEDTFVNRIGLSPDGRTFATAHHDATVRLWDAETGKPIAVLRGIPEVVWWAKFSPDGRWIASAGTERTVHIWEVVTGAEVARLTGHDHSVVDGHWLAGGRRIVASAGPEALLWNVAPPGTRPIDGDLWEDLAGDPIRAFRAQWALVADPPAAVRLLRERLAPAAAPPDDETLQKLVADLDSSQFRTRERAGRALADFGPRAEPYLRAARPSASAEAGRRIDEFLAGLTPAPTADDLRRARAVQVLELMRTPEARAVLGTLAAGHPRATLTEQAAAARKRAGVAGSD